MAKMNWDRVRQWDRVRGDSSDMELADARDERWFERERGKEESRTARSKAEASGRTLDSPRSKASPKQASSPKKGAPSTSTARAAPGSSKTRSNELAARLGVTREELLAARRAESKASAALVGLTPKDRTEKAARRLSITAQELTLLRRGLNGDKSVPAARLAALIRTIGRPSPTVVSTRASKASTSGSKPPRVASPRKSAPATSPTTAGRLAPTTPIFVTTWGNVVHLHHDCPSTRGFRNQNDPDPDIYRVAANDACCRGRRVCGTCTNRDSYLAPRLAQLLVTLHGRAFDERDWERFGWNRPLPKGKPISGPRR